MIGKMLSVTIVLGALVSIAAADLCPADPATSVPADAIQDDISDYHYWEAGLQIFTNSRINCDGQLTHWRFMSTLDQFSNVHLAVFRKRPISSLTRPTWDIVGQTVIRAAPKNYAPGQWITAAINPIDVQEGDYLGLFYDSYRILKDKVLIPGKDAGPLSNATTFVYLTDASNIVNNAVGGQYMVEQRVPALSALIRGLAALKAPLANQLLPIDAPTTQPTTTKRRPVPVKTTVATTTTEQPEPPTTQMATQKVRKPIKPVTTTTTQPPPTTQPVVPQTVVIVSFGAPTTSTTSTLPPGVLPYRCLQPAPQQFTFTCMWPGFRSFFDKDQGICQSFYGCQPSNSDDYANNFDSLQACKKACPETSSSSQQPQTPMIVVPQQQAQQAQPAQPTQQVQQFQPIPLQQFQPVQVQQFQPVQVQQFQPVQGQQGFPSVLQQSPQFPGISFGPRSPPISFLPQTQSNSNNNDNKNNNNNNNNNNNFVFPGSNLFSNPSGFFGNNGNNGNNNFFNNNNNFQMPSFPFNFGF